MNKIKGKKERKRKKGKEKEKRKGKKGKALSRKITRTNPCSGRVKTVSLFSPQQGESRRTYFPVDQLS